MKRSWISVSAISVVLVVSLWVAAGCGGGSSDQAQTGGEGLLGDATITFIGDTTHNEFPSRSIVLDDKVAVLLRQRPIDRSSGLPSVLMLQLRDQKGELIWSLPLLDPREDVVDLVAIDNRGMMLIQRLGENALDGVIIREFSTEDGSTTHEIEVPWDVHYSPWSIYSMPDDHLLVLGGKMAAAGSPFDAHGVVVDRDGNRVADWQSPATHLFPLESGFFGLQRVPGGRYPDYTFYGLSSTGELTWTIERADTLVGGVVMGAINTSDGDILLVCDDRNTRQPVFVLIGAAEGDVKWIKRNPETVGYTCYNPMRLDAGRIFIPCGKMQVDEANQQPPWSAVGGLVIDEDAMVLDSDLRTDFWMIPTMPAVELAAGRVVMIGIANVDPATFPRITDAGWLVAEVK